MSLSRRKKDALVGIKYFAGLGEEEDVLVRVEICIIEEVRGGIYEEDVFPAAAGHVADGRRGMMEAGGKGGEKAESQLRAWRVNNIIIWAILTR